MPRIELDLDPITHITTDAIGQPGSRVFYIQGWQEGKPTSLIIEKVQLQSMAIGLEEFLQDLHKKYPNLPPDSDEYDEKKMRILPPVDPLFRVGEMGLAYEADRDMVILVAQEVVMDGQTTDDVGVVRFWCRRSQLRAMCRWGLEVSLQGRQLCPQCGEPMDPAGHFCPKKNGHKTK
jgi:uncharacterized repeat protein (TIGR03847 family)